jgi:hypothetical protein
MSDLAKGYFDAGSKIASLKTFRQIKGDIKSLSAKANSSTEPANKNISNTLSKIEDQKNRLQKEVEGQFQQLIKLILANRGTGLSSTKYLKGVLLKSIKTIRPEIEQIVVDEIVKLLGCSQQQTYDGNQSLYIKVKNVDFKGNLKIDPESKVGKTKYERQKNLNTGDLKYPMNRQLRQRILDEGISYKFKGASGQDLFDITYVQQDNLGQPGDFFKIDLINRQNSVNKIASFLRDYYKRMSFVEFNVVISELMNAITGCVSSELNLGVNNTKDSTKFGRIMARVLGLCFDTRQEIDVSGVAKTGELDNLDDDFFEFNEVDLLAIDQEVYNIQNRAVEFEGCDNVKFPVNSLQIVESIDQLNFIDDENDDELINAFDNITNTFTNNSGFGLELNASFKLSFDFSAIFKLPLSLITSIFSPKVFLGFMIMLKSLQTNSEIDITSMEDFTKKYKGFFVGIVSKIGGLFIRELFKIIKREIVTLIRSIASDLSRENSLKKYAMILNLVAILIQIIKIIQDWRQCKNILDQILALLKLPGIGGNLIPAPLLAAAPLLPGYSVERSFVNSITELQKLGLPTGPLPDGSPNLGLVAMYSQLKGQATELWENGKSEILIPPLISPTGPTLPKTWAGKFV